MTWLSVAIGVGTSLIGMEQQRAVQKKQDQVLAQQLAQQRASEQKVAQRTQQFIQGQQQQTAQPEETAAKKSYDTALAANQHVAQQPLQMVGNVSDAYKKAGSDAALGISDFGSQRAGLTAAIDAPTQQRIDNQRNINNFGIDVNQINRAQKSQDYLDQLKLNSIHANPWLGLLTGVGSAFARARLGAGGFTTPSTSLAGNEALGGIDLTQPSY